MNQTDQLLQDLLSAGVRLTQKQTAALREKWDARFPRARFTDSSLLSTHQVAQLLQMDPSTISKWIDKGHITGFATPGGHRRVRVAELKEFLTSFKMPIPAQLGGAA